MHVSGIAFQDLTNATKQRRWQATTTLQKSSAGVPAATGMLAGCTAEEASACAGANRRAATLHTSSMPAGTSISGSLSKEQMADVQRQTRRLHRKRVARIVVEQWKWFTRERVKLYPAIRHHNHRLLLSALLALQRHSAHRQLEWRRAAIFNHRRQYLIQGKCLLLWASQLENSKRLQHRLDNARLTRHRRQLQSCLTAWKEYRAYKTERRKQHLQANFYRNFVLLTYALQQWTAAAKVSAAKSFKKSKALSFWASRQYAKGFSSWQLGMQARQHSHQMIQQASSLHKSKLTTAVVQHWHVLVSDIQAARQAGSEALQVLSLVSSPCWLIQVVMMIAQCR